MLAKDRTAYSETLIRGMSQPIVMIMIMAWLLAGVLGTLMASTGFVEALVWLAQHAGVSGSGLSSLVQDVLTKLFRSAENYEPRGTYLGSMRRLLDLRRRHEMTLEQIFA